MVEATANQLNIWLAADHYAEERKGTYAWKDANWEATYEHAIFMGMENALKVFGIESMEAHRLAADMRLDAEVAA